MDSTITVALDRTSVPRAVDWNARHFEVSDVPTRLDIEPVMMTHPLPGFVGWRFQATTADGESYVFDVRLDPATGGWRLIRTYR